jgi:hypothetical protein
MKDLDARLKHIEEREKARSQSDGFGFSGEGARKLTNVFSPGETQYCLRH